MKSKIIKIIGYCCVILAIFVGIFYTLKTNDFNGRIIENQLQILIDLYNSEETLSFENHLKNTTYQNVVKNDNIYMMQYKGYNVEIVDNKITKFEKIADEKFDQIFDSVQTMQNADLRVNEFVKTQSYHNAKNLGGAKYVIVENLGNDSDYIELKNGLYAKLVIENKTISIDTLGADNKGKEDNAKIIEKAISLCDGENITAISFSKGTYLCDSPIFVSNKNNINFLGNNACIDVRNSFNDETYREFFFNIYGSTNILINNLTIKYSFDKVMNGIKTQINIHTSSSVEFFNDNFIITENKARFNSENVACEYTNVDCYSNWKNVIINECSLENLSDSEAGGSLWIRDLYGLGSQDIKVLNSKFHKIAHDETIAVFMGSIENVLIKNNKFNVEDSGLSSSVMNFTFGSKSSKVAKNITFENNEIDMCSTGGLIWSTNATNLVIKNNKINSTISSKTSGNFRMFESEYYGDNEITKIETIENNKITLNTNLQGNSHQISIFSRIKNVKNNTIISNTKLTNCFIGCDDVQDNNVKLFEECEFLVYNATCYFINNTVELYKKIGSMFRWYGISLKNDITCKNNNIQYRYLENDDESSCIIMLNDGYMNNFVINFNNNIINAEQTSTKTRQVFVCPQDEQEQTFYYKENSVTGYSENHYIKNTNLVTE